eukprot:TRINITY_DN18216_c0_g1_i1.p2 TRINITY_DN18216_c0_g1~~TRINITY_DN18216_c0_g1_i1.p2  ORF type:complete len:411 (+),score=128.33 TRINITY_DN18216_c0_g1_i1:77-1234(+)
MLGPDGPGWGACAAAAGAAVAAAYCGCRRCRQDGALRMDIAQMPKVELHAHLGGSIRRATIEELLSARGLPHLKCVASRAPVGSPASSAQSRMDECFELFNAIYKVTDRLSVIDRITREVIEDYAAENTRYLELRTSLKSLEGRPAADYLDTVLQAVDAANHALGPRAVPTNVLVSVNRGNPAQGAEEAVRLAAQRKGRSGCKVVGIDFSGNCYKGVWNEFLPHLTWAQRNGLPVTVHAGEKDDDAELSQILDFGPARLGHLVFCGQRCQQRIKAAQIPVELCLTSNVITGNLKCLSEHHIERWWGHPFSINTDDRGVFSCTLASEFRLLRDSYRLSDASVLRLAARATDHCFIPEEEKRPLRGVFRDFARSVSLADPFTGEVLD